MLVVDSCFAVALLIDEEHSEFAWDVFDAIAGVSVLAPKLIWWELANVAVQKVRRGVITVDERADVWRRFDDLGIATESDPGVASLPVIANLADRCGLSAYDAAYLNLAIETGFSLATLDRRLALAAVGEGVTVFSPFAVGAA